MKAVEFGFKRSNDIHMVCQLAASFDVACFYGFDMGLVVYRMYSTVWMQCPNGSGNEDFLRLVEKQGRFFIIQLVRRIHSYLCFPQIGKKMLTDCPCVYIIHKGFIW